MDDPYKVPLTPKVWLLFCRNVRTARIAAPMTMKELAKKSGMPLRTLSRIEATGRRSTPPRTVPERRQQQVETLCAALGYRPLLMTGFELVQRTVLTPKRMPANGPEALLVLKALEKES